MSIPTMRVRCPACRLDQNATPDSEGKAHCQACGQRMKLPAPPPNKTMLAGWAPPADEIPQGLPVAYPAPKPVRNDDLPIVEKVLPSRRSRRDDDDDGYRDENPSSPAADSISLGLGVTSMVMGTIAILASLIPFCGAYVALPIGGIGLVLGGIGLLTCLSHGGRSLGFPIAGVVLCAAALVISLAWWWAWAEEKVQRARQNNQENRPLAPPPPPKVVPKKF